MTPLDYAGVIAVAYLLGALPTGYLLGRISKGVDVRTYGSGSTGATNVMRVLGKTAAALVFVGDFGKGVLAVWAPAALGLGPLAQALAGLAMLLGHNWPVFLVFKGGRGVASGVGGLFVVLPLAATAVALSALATMALTRYVSLGSMVGLVVALPCALATVLLSGAPVEYLVYVIPGSVLIVARHSGNIQRLLEGTEAKLGASVSLANSTRQVTATKAPKQPKRRTAPRRAPVG
ncbi:MAG: glycerol-3-phosphate 1-O-acyltransferase [Dehalococcoidia bacterium]|nr:glycerol-3-phosphate 1-O-acyltransferase [Dehalococcoidia bacterium]